MLQLLLKDSICECSPGLDRGVNCVSSQGPSGVRLTAASPALVSDANFSLDDRGQGGGGGGEGFGGGYVAWLI